MKTHAETYSIRSFDADFNQNATMSSLFRLLGDAAWKHATTAGFGFVHLMEKKLFWTLIRLEIQVNEYPGWGDTVQVHTWPTCRDRLYCYRDFRIVSESGDILANAASAWIAMDMETKRPRRTDDYYPVDDFLEERALNGNPPKLKGAGPTPNKMNFTARLSDIDVHGHVNNSVYVRWALDSLGMERWKTHVLTGLEVQFMAECVCGEDVVSNWSGEGERMEHAITRARDGAAVFRAVTRWQEK